MPVIATPSEPTHELGGIRFTSLATPSLGSIDTSVWRVEIAAGSPGVPHRLTREEVFVIFTGQADVRIGGHRATAGPGDVIVVPADVDFEITASGDDPLQAMCCLPVGGQAVLPNGDAFTPPWAL